MLLWVLIALLLAICMIAVLRPLWHDVSAAQDLVVSSDQAADIAVYRDQLKEIDADLERGLIVASEASGAKTEVARRLLQLTEFASERTDQSEANGDTSKLGKALYQLALRVPVLGRAIQLFALSQKGLSSTGANIDAARNTIRRAALYGGAAMVPVLTLGLYWFTGSPQLPSQPYAERMAVIKNAPDMSVLIAQVEAELQANPEHSEGWDVIAPVYLSRKRYGDAMNAYRRAIAISGKTRSRVAGLVDATTGVAMSKLSNNNGVVSPKVSAAFKQVLKLASGHPVASYWLAVEKEQNGKFDAAAAAYRAILRTAPAQAPWRQVVAGRLAELMAQRGEPASLPPLQLLGSKERGPTRDDIAAASSMTADDRSQMINNMVAGLAKRLKANGNDLRGWQKLVRAYVVLGKPGKAKQALAEARKSFASNDQALVTLAQMAKRFKLES